jgi:ABC-type Fe3+/spermidine/putrescine transport system ATPase subunit
MSSPILQIDNVSKRYGRNKVALQSVTLDVERGEILCLLGPSGSGKSTLLRIIAGLEEPSSGRIVISNRDQNGVPARERDVGFVFQTTEAVFPHMTVARNVTFPLRLKIRKNKHGDTLGRVQEMLRLVRLSQYGDQYPENLSGGERQRVAIARALVYRPSLLLLDEPLSSLDNILKRELIEIILDIHKELNPTIVYVTHDEREALELADRVAILNDGELLNISKPLDMLLDPGSTKVAEILGGWNIRTGNAIANDSIVKITFGTHSVDLPRPITIPVTTTPLTLAMGVPASQVEIQPQNGPIGIRADRVIFEGTVERAIPWYGKYIVHVICGNESWRVELPSLPQWIQPDAPALLGFQKNCVRLWR